MLSREQLDEIEKRFEDRRLTAEREAEERRKEVEDKNPALHSLGLRIRATAVRVLEESMKGGADLLARVEKIGRENLALQEEYAALLVSMGYDADYTKPRRVCTLCDDSGFIEGKACSCMKRELTLAAFRQSGIEKLLKKQRFDNFDLSYYSDTPMPEKRYSPRDVMKEIVQAAKDYTDSFDPDASPSLLFIGGTGLGKTHLSSAIAGKVIEKGFEVVYESAPDVAMLFERDRFQKEDDAADRLRRLFEAELLILDDLGTEPTSQTSAAGFYRLINTRASVMGKPTIVSTNLTYKQLEKQYDTAVLSRLLGEFEVKLFQGSDVRMAKLQ